MASNHNMDQIKTIIWINDSSIEFQKIQVQKSNKQTSFLHNIHATQQQYTTVVKGKCSHMA